MHVLEHEGHDLVENVEADGGNKEDESKIEKLAVKHVV